MFKLTLAFVFAILLSSIALCDNITVVNASFETPPVQGFSACPGTGCETCFCPIVGWTESVPGQSGQWQPGVQAGGFNYFNSLVDGNTIAFSQSGSISQTTSAVVQAGVTYTLQVDQGTRKDTPDPGVIDLVIGGSTLIQATGTAPPVGGWSVFTATYTGTLATAGQSIGIELNDTSGGQGEWDNVVLNSSINSAPEPSSILLFASCLVLVLWGARSRLAANSKRF